MNRSILVALAVALMSSVLGCGVSSHAVDFAVRTGDGRMWISGTNGFGAVESGGYVQRLDYPTDGDGSYDTFQFPAANVLEVRGKPLLVTRLGELMEPAADGERWQPLSVQPEIGDRFNRQVDYATVTRDGLVFLHVHSDRLLWLAPGETKPRREETMPSYMEHVTLDGDTVVGLGYRGSLRVVMERSKPGEWRELGVLPSWGSDVRAFARIGGRWVAPTYYGVFVQGPTTEGLVGLRKGDVEGGFYRISTDALLARSSVVVAEADEVHPPSVPVPRRGDLVVASEEPTEQPIATSPIATSQIEVSGPANSIAVASDPLQVPLDLNIHDSRIPPKVDAYILRAFALGDGRLALEVAGGWTGFLVLSARGLERLPCRDPRAYNAVSAVALESTPDRGLIAVSDDASTYEVSVEAPGGCRALAPGMIARP